MLFLPEGDGDDSEVFAPFSLCKDLFKLVEPAGEKFEEIVKLFFFGCSFSSFCEDVKEEEKNEEEEKEEEDNSSYFWESSISFKKKNFYQILGIENKIFSVKTDEIRKAYKEMALKFHPDKLVFSSSAEEKTQNEKWLQVKEAYETLIDPQRRKAYDSSAVEFDDGVPEDERNYSPSSFFLTFGPVFLRNSVWSKKKPVPKLGDINTPLEKVRKFYAFWRNFESWREFTVEGEYDLNDAESRFEKRQMVKENRKKKAAMVRGERGRISLLVERAYKNDPRIIAENLRISEEKKKEKEKKKKRKRKKNRKRKKREGREDKARGGEEKV